MSKAETKPTPKPLRFVTTRNETFIVDENEQVVADMPRALHCVRVHDDLLAACEEVENWVENTQDLETDEGAVMLLDLLRAAIAATKEG